MHSLRKFIIICATIVGVLGIAALLMWLRVVRLIPNTPGDYSQLPDTKGSFAQEIQSTPVPISANKYKTEFIQEIKTDQSDRSTENQNNTQIKAHFIQSLSQ